MTKYLKPVTPDLSDLENMAVTAAAGWISWSKLNAPNQNLKALAEKLAGLHLQAANILDEMSKDPDSPRHKPKTNIGYFNGITGECNLDIDD